MPSGRDASTTHWFSIVSAAPWARWSVYDAERVPSKKWLSHGAASLTILQPVGLHSSLLLRNKDVGHLDSEYDDFCVRGAKRIFNSR
jgi:hypothetical protein